MNLTMSPSLRDQGKLVVLSLYIFVNGFRMIKGITFAIIKTNSNMNKVYKLNRQFGSLETSILAVQPEDEIKVTAFVRSQ